MTYDDNNCYGIGSYCNHNHNPTLTLIYGDLESGSPYVSARVELRLWLQKVTIDFCCNPDSTLQTKSVVIFCGTCEHQLSSFCVTLLSKHQVQHTQCCEVGVITIIVTINKKGVNVTEKVTENVTENKVCSAENISLETANIPVVGMASCGFWEISLPPASIFTSTESTAMYTWHITGLRTMQ